MIGSGGGSCTCRPQITMLRNRIILLLLVLLVLLSSLLLLTTDGPNRAVGLHSLVKETQQHLTNIKKSFKEEDLLSVHETYLGELGLLHSPRPSLWPNSSWHRARNASTPVVLSAVSKGRAGEAVHFLRNTALYFPEVTVVLYDLGLSSHEVRLVKKYCNSTLCILKEFDASKYPGHVKNLQNHAYRPLVIQRTLMDAGCVLWLDIDQRFVVDSLVPLLSLALSKSGVLAWPMDGNNVPTSSRTHPGMFAKLGSSAEDFNFQHMVDLRALLVYNLPNVHMKLMGPWVKCALMEECLDPVGAQSTGCRFDKKPQYRYSGCHSYDVSALNVVLGQMFQWREDDYMSDETKFFAPMDEVKEENDEAEDDLTQSNATERSVKN